ncbi:hypothetical protein Tco_1386483 [Tanacetum coccineum]
MRILASLQFRVFVSTGLDFKKAETCTEEVLVVFVFWIKVIGFELGLMDSLRSKKALRSNQSNSGVPFEGEPEDSGWMSNHRSGLIGVLVFCCVKWSPVIDMKGVFQGGEIYRYYYCNLVCLVNWVEGRKNGSCMSLVD